jgi:hypothetical protein
LRTWKLLSSQLNKKPIGGIKVLGPASKNLHSIRFSTLLFLFELEKFTLYGFSATLDLPLAFAPVVQRVI